MIKFIQGAVVVFLLLGCIDKNETDAGTQDTSQEDARQDAGQDGGSTDTENTPKDPRIKEDSMVEEIIWIWNEIFDDAGASKDDYRREKFEHYAKMLAKHIRFMQTDEALNLFQVKLPTSRYTHLLAAFIIYRESSIKPETEGRSHGEVGFFQLHGVALQGHSRKEVQNNPELGIILGLRWLSKAVQVCHTDNTDNWSFDNWLGPLAVYGGGEARAITNKKCERNWKFAKDRVNKTKSYAMRLLANKG